ncbi:threonine aldolase family protein [Brumimicrobium oceani]|uniref:Threonine aldolase n=1 Tax=Brumimicrobium oceani TaxID=2100725 RepID=A0A2U2XGB2_9FLAO|nr:GntG family PLP-dependent aldolase [Brumimicrobium oceani]PWH86836.1 threonine aldolase [Brumimicrobium oceani]
MLTDLRSDTVTKPSKEMKAFMMEAPVGDDVFQEDPTVNELEKYAAEYFGMEAALYCSSGTQTNQIAINVHCRPGDEVICSKDAHIYFYEGGGIAKNSGSSVLLLPGDRGRITAKDVEGGIKDPNNPHYPLTSLVSLEDTMNRGGGAIYDFNEIKAIRKVCEENQLPLHLDGARLFNALVENNIPPKEYAAQFDSISICLSKGLGAPVGSVLLGNKEFIHRARRARKVLGGGMRQAGIIAAGGLYAMKNNIERLKEDHKHAKQLGAALEKLNWVEEILPVQTNIVVAKLSNKMDVVELIAECAKKDLHFMAFGEQTIRMVTHLDVKPNNIDHAISVLEGI